MNPTEICVDRKRLLFGKGAVHQKPRSNTRMLKTTNCLIKRSKEGWKGLPDMSSAGAFARVLIERKMVPYTSRNQLTELIQHLLDRNLITFPSGGKPAGLAGKKKV